MTNDHDIARLLQKSIDDDLVLRFHLVEGTAETAERNESKDFILHQDVPGLGKVLVKIIAVAKRHGLFTDRSRLAGGVVVVPLIPVENLNIDQRALFPETAPGARLTALIADLKAGSDDLIQRANADDFLPDAATKTPPPGNSPTTASAPQPSVAAIETVKALATSHYVLQVPTDGDGQDILKVPTPAQTVPARSLIAGRLSTVTGLITAIISSQKMVVVDMRYLVTDLELDQSSLGKEITFSARFRDIIHKLEIVNCEGTPDISML